jgi:SET domain-containing protein
MLAVKGRGLKHGETWSNLVINQKVECILAIAESEIEGTGCFAAIPFPKDLEIAEYVGERITVEEATRRLQGPGKKRICEVDEHWSIDGSRGGNGTEYVNHSCEPNSYLNIFEGRIFLHALRDIAPGEEITTDYLYELQLDCTRCNCRTRSCAEKIN